MEEKTPKKEKAQKLDGFNIYIDAEWTTDNIPVSIQMEAVYPNGKSETFVVINKLYESTLDIQLIKEWSINNYTHVLFDHLSQDSSIVHTLLVEYYVKKYLDLKDQPFYFRGNVFLFYSFQDLGFAFGWNKVEKQLKKELAQKNKFRIEQKRSITGLLKIEDSFSTHKNEWRIKDLCGLTNMGLKDFASSLGLSMAHKSELDEYKTCMDQALINKTITFLDYAQDDVIKLKLIFQEFLTFTNELILNTLNMPSKFLFTAETIPLTAGKLVATVFENYIFHQAQKTSQHLYYQHLKSKGLFNYLGPTAGANSAFYLALWSLSIFKRDFEKGQANVKIYNDLFQKRDLDLVLDKALEHGKIVENWVYNSPFQSFPYSAASIKTLSQTDARTTSLLNCLVSGGRAINEYPWDYRLDYIFDIDLQSCYGTALASFEYPIGLPTIIAFAPNEEHLSLRDFLNLYENELIDGLYKITVSGNLSFSQDILFSKITTYSQMSESLTDFNAKFENESDDVVHFANDFVLARKECLNSVITSDILEILRKVCNSREYSEILKLKVETAIFWKKTDRIQSSTEWIKTVLQNPGQLAFDEQNQTIKDTRTRKWYSLPLKGFIGNLVTERNKIKKESKEETTQLEKTRLTGKQNILKLFINTLYGCLASPYFSIGNVVLADNITARARVEVWKLCKALNLRQSITDGGIYTPTCVNIHKAGNFTRKPGLESLSDIRNLAKSRFIKQTSMGYLNWPEIFQNNEIKRFEKQLDNMALETANSFWRPYNLGMILNIEHKLSNIAIQGIYSGKANYALKVRNSTTGLFTDQILKLRGHKADQEANMPVIMSLYKSLLDGSEKLPETYVHKTKKILKLGQWKISQSSKKNKLLSKTTLPGQAYETLVNFVFKDSHFPYENVKDFLTRKRNSFTAKLYEPKKGDTYTSIFQRMVQKYNLKMVKQTDK